MLQETARNDEVQVEEEEEKETRRSHLAKSVLQAKLQRLAILIGYFGTRHAQL